MMGMKVERLSNQKAVKGVAMVTRKLPERIA